MMKGADRIVVALCGVSAPGYRSLANAYLREALKADPRLPEVWVTTPDYTTAADPWWIAYQLLALDPAPDVVGFSVMCFNARAVFDAIRVFRSVRPGTFVVVGGPEVGPIPQQTLAEQAGIDAVVMGEGERTLPDLLYSLVRGGDPTSVPGVAARDGDRIVVGPEREPVDALDALPSPFAAGGHATDGSAYLETYRGCPHRCSYCYEGKGSTRIRSFGWNRIASDIEALAGTPGMRSFSFIDPVFNLTPERLRHLSDLMAPWAAKGIRLHTIEVDIERIGDDEAALLARAGVVSVETGPQSTGEDALRECRRSFDPERFAAGVAACKRAGISVECDLIVGLPGDTLESVRDAFDFVMSLDPGKIQLSTLHVLPGTDLWNRRDELGLIFDPQAPHELIQTAEMTYAELRHLEVSGNAAAAVYRARIPREDP
jgi:anaerobic magnesium-protoporphyrin IX monomethyl ester cyclase